MGAVPLQQKLRTDRAAVSVFVMEELRHCDVLSRRSSNTPFIVSVDVGKQRSFRLLVFATSWLR